jgi:hypothetical protein
MAARAAGTGIRRIARELGGCGHGAAGDQRDRLDAGENQVSWLTQLGVLR